MEEEEEEVATNQVVDRHDGEDGEIGSASLREGRKEGCLERIVGLCRVKG